MMHEVRSHNPFAPPGLHDTAAQGPVRPGLLTFLCFVAIVLGVLGIFSWLTGVVGMVIGNRMQQAIIDISSGDGEDEIVQAQFELQEEIYQAANRHRGVNIVLLIVQFFVASGLLYGGIQTLRLRPSGRSILWTVCCVAVVFEISRGVLFVLMQMQSMAIINNFQPTMETEGSDAGQIPVESIEVFTNIMMMVIIAGMVFYFMMVGVKAVYYVITAVYLHRFKVRALFAGAADG